MEASPGGYDRYDGCTTEEKRLEKMLDEERYYALYKNEEEEATMREEEFKRLQQQLEQVTSHNITYNQVPFSYSSEPLQVSILYLNLLTSHNNNLFLSL